jgi:cytochrome b561
MSTTKNPVQFAFLSRILHWLMAAFLIAMLFIGVSMVASLGDYHKLLAIHRPLGILILILAAIRLITRLLTKAPALPSNIWQPERHTILAYLLFLAFLAHLGAVLFHTLILRDGILSRMVPWTVRPAKSESRS